MVVTCTLHYIWFVKQIPHWLQVWQGWRLSVQPAVPIWATSLTTAPNPRAFATVLILHPWTSESTPQSDRTPSGMTMRCTRCFYTHPSHEGCVHVGFVQRSPSVASQPSPLVAWPFLLTQLTLTSDLVWPSPLCQVCRQSTSSVISWYYHMIFLHVCVDVFLATIKWKTFQPFTQEILSFQAATAFFFLLYTDCVVFLPLDFTLYTLYLLDAMLFCGCNLFTISTILLDLIR